MTMGDVTEFVERFAKVSRAPVRTGADVTSVRRTDDGYRVTTSGGEIACRAVVIASGACTGPPCRSSQPRFRPRSSSSRRSVTASAELPDGGVLVVGASATGVQLAAELRRSGRPVTLAVGEHVRMPRTYRGKDVLWWMDAVGCGTSGTTRSTTSPGPGSCPRRSSSPPPNGPRSTSTSLHRMGIELACRWAAVRDGSALFSGGLRGAPALADLKLGRLLDTFDEWALTSGRDAEFGPPERFAATHVPASPRLQLDLRGGEIRRDRVGDRVPARLRVARRARGRREGPAAPRGRRGRQPGTLRAGAARAAAAQVDVHFRYRGRRARGDRSPRAVPGRAWLTPGAGWATTCPGCTPGLDRFMMHLR